MSERTIMDEAGDLWTVEGVLAGPEGGGARTMRCRHELGYELLVVVSGDGPLDDAGLVEALERARLRVPRGELAEAA